MTLPGKPLQEFWLEAALCITIYSIDGNQTLQRVPEGTATHGYPTFEEAYRSMPGHDKPIWTTLDVTEIKRRQRDKEIAEFNEWYQ